MEAMALSRQGRGISQVLPGIVADPGFMLADLAVPHDPEPRCGLEAQAHLHQEVQGACSMLEALGSERPCFLQKAKQHGIKNRAGDVWSWPGQGFLFPSRRGASKKYMQKDTMCHMISKVRKSFLKKFPHYKGEKTIKSHSGRRHAISSFAGGGLSADVGMIFAQITSFRIYQKYIDAEPQHVARQMKAFDRQNRIA